MKVAFITGITGQDGSYLAELLLKKDYIVHGLIRRSSNFNTKRIDHLRNGNNYKDRFFLHYGDLCDSSALTKVIHDIHPDEIYNLGAQSHVSVSFMSPISTTMFNAMGTINILDAVKNLDLQRKIKFYQASSSELYGKVLETPQKETTPFYPRSPYAVSKLYAYWITINYREAYNIFASNGILFNHESPRRGETFITRKITRALTRIKLGLQETLLLGNLNAKRDWGHAKDYVYAQWLILQQDKSDDFVIATGKQYSVREFCHQVAKNLDMDLYWEGDGLNEVGYVNSKKTIYIDERYYRPTEVDNLLGDSSKAKKILGWTPEYSFEDLVKEMVESDLALAKQELLLVNN